MQTSCWLRYFERIVEFRLMISKMCWYFSREMRKPCALKFQFEIFLSHGILMFKWKQQSNRLKNIQYAFKIRNSALFRMYEVLCLCHCLKKAVLLSNWMFETTTVRFMKQKISVFVYKNNAYTRVNRTERTGCYSESNTKNENLYRSCIGMLLALYSHVVGYIPMDQ